MAILEAGKKAPAIVGKDQDGNKFSSSLLKGKKWVLYFYPADDTPTCTVQACNIRDNFSVLKKAGIEIIGVSPDEEKKHKKFQQKYDLPFTMLADPDHTIIDKFGVWGEKQMYGRTYMGIHRTSFLVDEKGIIQKVFLKPKSKMHVEEIMQAWKDIEQAHNDKK